MVPLWLDYERTPKFVQLVWQTRVEILQMRFWYWRSLTNIRRKKGCKIQVGRERTVDGG